MNNHTWNYKLMIYYSFKNKLKDSTWTWNWVLNHILLSPPPSTSSPPVLSNLFNLQQGHIFLYWQNDSLVRRIRIFFSWNFICPLLHQNTIFFLLGGRCGRSTRTFLENFHQSPVGFWWFNNDRYSIFSKYQSELENFQAVSLQNQRVISYKQEPNIDSLL